MRRGVACVAAVLAAWLGCCGIQPAAAEAERDAAAVAHLLFFSGADIWRNGAFSHGGFL